MICDKPPKSEERYTGQYGLFARNPFVLNAAIYLDAAIYIWVANDAAILMRNGWSFEKNRSTIFALCS